MGLATALIDGLHTEVLAHVAIEHELVAGTGRPEIVTAQRSGHLSHGLGQFGILVGREGEDGVALVVAYIYFIVHLVGIEVVALGIELRNREVVVAITIGRVVVHGIVIGRSLRRAGQVHELEDFRIIVPRNIVDTGHTGIDDDLDTAVLQRLGGSIVFEHGIVV